MKSRCADLERGRSIRRGKDPGYCPQPSVSTLGSVLCTQETQSGSNLESRGLGKGQSVPVCVAWEVEWEKQFLKESLVLPVPANEGGILGKALSSIYN